MLTIISGLSLDPNSAAWLVHYARASSHDGGDIYLVSFDESWEEFDTSLTVEGSFQRPHSVVVGEELYLGYDGGGAYLSRFRYVGPLVGTGAE
jgi:hypothetical protein